MWKYADEVLSLQKVLSHAVCIRECRGDPISMPPRKTAPNKSTKKSTSSQKTPAARRWSAKVDTDSTHPEPGLFEKGPRTVAQALASKKVSPKGPASGMRMLNFYINRAGNNLTEDRLAVLQRAKTILSGIIAKKKNTTPSDPKVKRKLPSRKSSKKQSTRK